MLIIASQKTQVFFWTNINLQEICLNILWFFNFYFLKSKCQFSYSCVYCIFYVLFLSIFLPTIHSFCLLFFLPPSETLYLILFLRNTQILRHFLQLFRNLLRAFTLTFKDWYNTLQEYAAERPPWRGLGTLIHTRYFSFWVYVEDITLPCAREFHLAALYYLHVRYPPKQEKNVRVREAMSSFPIGILRELAVLRAIRNNENKCMQLLSKTSYYPFYFF